LCIDSTTIVSISAPSNDIVRVEIKHERTFKNITGHTEPFYGTFAVDEWGFSQKSEILECRLEIGETKIDDADDNPDYEGKKDAIGKKTKSVSVKSGNTIKSITKGFEIHRPNGELHMQFSYPSRRPKVRVETPSGFSHSCTFGIPDEKVIRSSISQDYTLDGTQFPGQHTRVRWWPDCGMRLSQSTSSIVGFCVIAALMGFSLAAHAEDVRKSKPILPPPEYDAYYPGGFVVLTVPTHSELVRMCGQKHEPFHSCSGKDAKGKPYWAAASPSLRSTDTEVQQCSPKLPKPNTSS
jgi:hypothetical protein